ncbi:MAG: chromosome segregation protein SMC [Firmicutes bacterium]|nr:chromosome segregation protein SMC [Bacillota bacterium]
MHIKRLEMSGFKSFADKTVFTLTPGITVIVGPNGCGKSNIADAVRWVLGEQSARYLRGLRMDDIIFNGTTQRKPLSYAEVSVTLDNTDGALGLDYQEVTVTRRLYRSGESEYLLNRRPCRLRDILELFMDTGVGREAYSFIGQGRIEEIIAAKPEERRQIFEEAAGIAKYKARKREAQRRLAETAENLLRVGDIITELKMQLEPLQAQARQAQNYLAFREKLKALEVNVLVAEAQKLLAGRDEAEAKANAAADELRRNQAALNRLEAGLAERQLHLDEVQEAAAAERQELQQLAAELEKLQRQLAVRAEKSSNVEKQLAEAQAALQEMELQAEQLTAEKEQLGARQSRLHSLLAAAEEEMAAAEAKLRNLENSPEEQRARALQEELARQQEESRRLQSVYDRLVLEKIQLEEKKNLANARQEEKRREMQAVQRELAALREKAGSEKRRLQELMEQMAAQNKELAALRESREKCQQKLQEAQEKLSGLQNRLAVLQELDTAMAGYYQGVKTVLAAGRKILPGIYGTVADVITVPPRYVTALEAALGPALQHLVAENEEAAKAAIAYLKRTKGGRATFLPLSVLSAPPRRRLPELEKLAGYLGCAAGAVKADAKFQPAVEALLSRIHLVSDMDAALAAARLLQFRERVVTLDGDVIQPGGAMSGGFAKKEGGILARRREKAELQVHTAEEAKKLRALQDENARLLRRQAELEEQGKETEKRLQQAELASKLAEKDLAYRQKQLAALEAEASALTDAVAVAAQELAKQQAALQEAAEKLAQAGKEENALKVELAHLSGVLAAREQEKRALQAHYTECRVRLASLRQQEENLETEAERLRRESVRLQEKRGVKLAEISKAREMLAEIAALTEEDRQAAAELKKSYNKYAAGLMQHENSIKQLQTVLREETEKLRGLEKSLTVLERKKSRLELEKERLDSELQLIRNRLQESWELDFSMAEKMARPVPDLAVAQDNIRRLKMAIQELGTVNLGAIEEYKRVAERVDFLTAQKQDLEAGEKDLLSIVAELDSRMEERFASAFAGINNSFNQVFRDLFGGGRARLQLTDPDNPLEAGVEIIAQPPGKKLQHLSLLSGGEKALTAIALFFAFLKVRPTPFCILDEIETALDDANLARFCNYLKNYAQQTQFILISHRKKTMEQADILYGVTMEESGVSKIISVRLRDDKNSAAAGA